MDKIIKALLQYKFEGIEIDALLEIINATPNPVVATELLCGVYEEPEISPNPGDDWFKNNTNECCVEFVSYDKFTGDVTYTYNYRKSVKYWNLKGNPPCDINDIPEKFKGSWSDDVARMNGFDVDYLKNNYEPLYAFEEPDKTKRKGKTSLQKWNK